MDVNETFARLEHQVNRLTEVLETLRQKNGELNGQVQSLEEKNCSLQAAIKSLEEKASTAGSENEQLKKDKEEVTGRIAQLLSRLDSAVGSEYEPLEQVEAAHLAAEQDNDA